MKLHGYWRSTSSWRVRIGLELKRVPYEYQAVNLLKGEQKSEAIAALNAFGQVPVLVLDDGFALSQSMAILELLDELHPSPPLLPGDARRRARARQIAELVNSGTQPLQNLGTLERVRALAGDAAAKAWASSAITTGLDAVESIARTTAGQYLVGDDVTLADVLVVPQLYNARRYGADPARWPTLATCEAQAGELEAFRRAHPDRQPDAQPSP